MYAYELLPKLIFLTLTVVNTAEYWEEKLEWVGTNEQRKYAEVTQTLLENKEIKPNETRNDNFTS